MDFSFKELTETELTSEIVREFYRYWDQQRGSRRYPSRADIRLADTPGAEPYSIICQITYPPFSVCYTGLGAQIVYYYKRDFTSHYLHDIFEGPMLRHFEVPHRIAMTRPLPLLGVEDWPGTKMAYEWGIFPLSDDDVTINCTLL